jgi:hypothetical protein
LVEQRLWDESFYVGAKIGNQRKRSTITSWAEGYWLKSALEGKSEVSLTGRKVA